MVGPNVGRLETEVLHDGADVGHVASASEHARPGIMKPGDGMPHWTRACMYVLIMGFGSHYLSCLFQIVSRVHPLENIAI